MVLLMKGVGTLAVEITEILFAAIVHTSAGAFGVGLTK